MTVRPATRDDVPAILDVYNQVLETSDAIWSDHPVTLVDRLGWFREQQERGDPVLVAVDDTAEADGGPQVVGYGSFVNFRTLPGYATTVEHSIHLADGHRGRGLGQELLDALTALAVERGKAVMVAGIDAGTEGSIRFHARNGFREVARLPGVGRKHGRPVDLVLMQKELPVADHGPADEADAAADADADAEGSA